VRTTATGAESVRAIGTGSTNYSVTGVGETSGGNVVFVTAPTSAETVTIIRNSALTQGTDYQPATNFPAASHEEALDKLTHIVQELDEEMGRTVKVSRSTTISSSEITDDADTRASKLLGFDSDGDLESTTGRVSSVSVSNVATSSGSPGTATASFTTSSGALALGIPIGQTGMAAGVSLQYSTTTTDADPGAGFFRTNNTNLSGGSCTQLYIQDSDGSNTITDWVQSWDDSTSTTKGFVTICGNPNHVSPFVVFRVTAITDATNYTKVTVVYVAGSSSISNSAECSLSFTRAGDKGSDADNVFKTISVSGQDDVVADAVTDTLTLAAGEGVDITTTAGTDTITFAGEDTSVTNKGVVELATTAETTTGTDTARAVTPAGLHGALAGLTDTTITTSDTVIFADATDSNALKEDTVQGILDLVPSSGLSAASVAEMEAASSNTVAVTPGRITRSPLVLKVAGAFENDGSLMTSTIGVSSVSDNGTGTFEINFSTNFGSTYFTPVATAHGTAARSIVFDARSTSDVDVYVFDAAGSAADPGNCYFHIQGDQ
jgi:hypothetical protein